MNTVKIIFAKSNTLGGLIIRLGTMSHENHVAIQIGDDVYDTRFSKGVLKTSRKDFNSHWNETDTYIVTPDCSVDMARSFLDAQVGRRYDWRAIIAMPLRLNWQHHEDWFCSELVAAALNQMGFNFPISSNRISPRDLKLVLGTSKSVCKCEG